MQAPGELAEWSASDLRRLLRAHRTLSASNRALLRAVDEPSLLAEFCRIVVEEGGYRLAWVSRADHDEAKTVQPLAHAGFNEGYLESVRISWADTEVGQGPTGTAIRTGKPSVIQSIPTDPREAPWREASIAHGYGSLLSVPLRVEGRIFGAISIVAPETEAFDEEEVRLLVETADDLAFGIETLRGRLKVAQSEEIIRRMAFFDALTGLPNRVNLREQLEAAIGAARRQNRPLGLLHLELGRLREISEILGCQEADAVLQASAAQVVDAVRGRGTVARAGEDAFAVLLPANDSESALQVAHDILAALRMPKESAGLALDAKPSIGIALFPGHGGDPDTLLHRAGVANHQAKRSGRDCAVYTGGLDSECSRRLALMADLRRAIERNELMLYCQPKADIRSGRICGAEALVRWEHPLHGAVNPTEFITLAESTGLITPLTYWMLGAALRQSYAWHEAGMATPLAVNLSSRDLRDPKLLDKIRGSFATWGAQPDWIQFELTESALMEDPAGARDTLAHLKALGVELFIDDFGTGYSSLAYLQKLPVDSIKIDQSFVSHMTVDEDSAVIVGSTIELAHNLGLHVVAEGVENRETLDRLARLGCEVAQGYCISRPIPVDHFADWLSRFAWPWEGLSPAGPGP